MKRIRLSWGILAAFCVIAATSGAVQVQAGDTSPTSVSLDAAYSSKYVWRGLVGTDDPVVQPSLTFAGDNGVSLNLWGNLETTDVNDNSGNFTEIDYTLDYSWETAGVGLSAGVVNYTFPNTGYDSTTEAYLAASWDGPGSPSAAIYYDLDEADGFYVNLGVGHSVPVSEVPGAPAVDFSASLGLGSSDHNDFYYGEDKFALVDLVLGASMDFSVGESFGVTPFVSYSRVMDSDLRDAVSDPDNFFYGVSVSFAF